MPRGITKQQRRFKEAVDWRKRSAAECQCLLDQIQRFSSCQTSVQELRRRGRTLLTGYKLHRFGTAASSTSLTSSSAVQDSCTNTTCLPRACWTSQHWYELRLLLSDKQLEQEEEERKASKRLRLGTRGHNNCDKGSEIRRLNENKYTSTSLNWWRLSNLAGKTQQVLTLM